MVRVDRYIMCVAESSHPICGVRARPLCKRLRLLPRVVGRREAGTAKAAVDDKEMRRRRKIREAMDGS